MSVHFTITMCELLEQTNALCMERHFYQYVAVPQRVTVRAASSGSVESAMVAILGIPPSQRELLAIRAALFADILPQATRSEKRRRDLNMGTFEAFRSKVIPMLSHPAMIAAILNLVMQHRRSFVNDKILMNLFVLE
jgi:hypothetical protein